MFRWFRKSKSTGDTTSEYSTSAFSTSVEGESVEEESDEENSDDEDLEEQDGSFSEEGNLCRFILSFQIYCLESDADTVVDNESGVSSLDEEESTEPSESVEIITEKKPFYRQNTVKRPLISAIEV